MKIFYLFLFSVVMTVNLTAQNNTEAIVSDRVVPHDSVLIQLSGVVVSNDSLSQLSYATVYNKTSRRGVIADFYGFFSMVVIPKDTILFSYFGYKTSFFIVPDTLTENRYSIIHMMFEDGEKLPEITVYPWPSKEDFARAFVEMKGQEDAIKRAQRQLSGENLAFAASKLSTDASISYGNLQNMHNTQLYTMRQTPVNNLLNPYAWASFIQAWKTGKLKKQ